MTNPTFSVMLDCECGNVLTITRGGSYQPAETFCHSSGLSFAKAKQAGRKILTSLRASATAKAELKALTAGFPTAYAHISL